LGSLDFRPSVDWMGYLPSRCHRVAAGCLFMARSCRLLRCKNAAAFGGTAGRARPYEITSSAGRKRNMYISEEDWGDGYKFVA
jgi:hypothetical protein